MFKRSAKPAGNATARQLHTLAQPRLGVRLPVGIFALCTVQPPVLEVLDISGLMSMVDVHSGRAALAALA